MVSMDKKLKSEKIEKIFKIRNIISILNSPVISSDEEFKK